MVQKDGVLKMRKLKKLVLNAIAESGITEDEDKLSRTFEQKVSQVNFVHFIVCLQIVVSIEY